MNTGTKILAAIVVVIVVGFLVYWFDSNSQNQVTISEKQTDSLLQESENAPVNTSVQTQNSNAPQKNNNKYSDGTFTVNTSYMSPGGKDDLGVSITIKNDFVSDLKVVNGGHDKTSFNYQTKFISGINSQVVGKSVDSVNIGVVSGASLTSAAFNNALAQIKAQATVQ